MTANEKTITTFETRLRQLMLRFKELKKENEDLYAMMEENEKSIARLHKQLEQQQSDYQSLKMARMLEITDGNLTDAKERLAGLIRDVKRCIDILSDEK